MSPRPRVAYQDRTMVRAPEDVRAWLRTRRFVTSEQPLCASLRISPSVMGKLLDGMPVRADSVERVRAAMAGGVS